MNREHLVLTSGLVMVLIAALLLPLAAQQAGSQSAQGAKRTVLDRHDLSIPGYEGVLVRTELTPGAREPRHTHPGDVLAYVEEGTVTLSAEGKPQTTVNAGGVFFVPAGQIHWAENQGGVPVKMLVNFVVQKGKPLTTPVE